MSLLNNTQESSMLTKPTTDYWLNSISNNNHNHNHPETQSINQYNKNQLYIQLIDSLDRELYHQYYIQIIAMDQSINHRKTGTLTLFIEIADINDQLPIFEYNQYLFHLIENSPKAKDNGQPSKSTITNVIIEIDDINDNNPIIDLWGYKEILNSTGIMMTTTTSTTDIQHSSLIPFYLISSENSFIPIHIWVSELLNIRSILSIVKVNDLDQGINGTVQYYELQIIHHLPILCYDLGVPIARTSTVLLNIHIKDENDNEPKFLIPEIFTPAQWINKNLLNLMLTPLEILIPETCPINTVILKFPVLDIDSGMNSMLNYELRSINQYLLNSLNLSGSTEINNMIDFIRINHTTGEIIICQSLKLIPEYYKYIYEVIVKDQGIPSKVSRLHFSLQILIVNSFPPEVELLKPNHLNRTILEVHKSKSNKKYEIEMYENEPAGTQIARMIGYDPDRGDAGRITFILIQNLIKTCIGSYKKIDDAISIDPNKGLITTLRPLDRELDGNLLLLTLHIQDHGIPIYTTTIHIHIKILDINDNPPIFLLPLYSCHSLDRLRNSDHQKHDRSSCHSSNIYPTPNITNQLYNMTIVLPKQSNHDLLHSFIQFQTIDYDLVKPYKA
ncbi:cadherin-related [Schistosoma mansoni]|uniref:cadherin-related n=1 Tax=Schistosoma mansoni TaxID=6183 RepID=UPI0001A63F06|nr:cadherin-related [Schistosoma mansoni]|eukprot:XP_018652363.1 cadherin-related [Schistosoma mansoni]